MSTYPYLERPPHGEEECFRALITLARYLRSPEGCPWDRRQTAGTFAKFLKEEAAEYEEACVEGDGEHMAEEWGDTLFTLLASAAAAEECGAFDIETAMLGIREKMIRRHDHVFGEDTAETPEEVEASWARIKEKERRRNK